MVWVSIILAISPVIIVGFALHQRNKIKKGIGWQFIRFTVLTNAIPIVGVLALNGMLTGEAATIIGSAMAFAFGKATEQNDRCHYVDQSKA